MNGKSSDQFNFLREKLLKILSHVEAKIDFPDEDLPREILKENKINSNEVLKKIEKILDDQKVEKELEKVLRLQFLDLQMQVNLAF